MKAKTPKSTVRQYTLPELESNLDLAKKELARIDDVIADRTKKKYDARDCIDYRLDIALIIGKSISNEVIANITYNKQILESLNKRVEESNQKITEQSEHLKNLQAESSALESKNAKLRAETLELEDMNSNLQATVNDKKRFLSDENSSRRRAIEKKKEALKDLEDTITSKQLELEKFESTIEVHKKRRMVEVGKEIDLLDKRKDAILAEIKNLETLLQEKQKQKVDEQPKVYATIQEVKDAVTTIVDAKLSILQPHPNIPSTAVNVDLAKPVTRKTTRKIVDAEVLKSRDAKRADLEKRKSYGLPVGKNLVITLEEYEAKKAHYHQYNYHTFFASNLLTDDFKDHPLVLEKKACVVLIEGNMNGDDGYYWGPHFYNSLMYQKPNMGKRKRPILFTEAERRKQYGNTTVVANPTVKTEPVTVESLPIHQAIIIEPISIVEGHSP
jgi:chromosome segregation ATPase